MCETPLYMDSKGLDVKDNQSEPCVKLHYTWIPKVWMSKSPLFENSCGPQPIKWSSWQSSGMLCDALCTVHCLSRNADFSFPGKVTLSPPVGCLWGVTNLLQPPQNAFGGPSSQRKKRVFVRTCGFSLGHRSKSRNCGLFMSFK